MFYRLKLWLSSLETRAVVLSMVILLAGIGAAVASTAWSNISEQRGWIGEKIYLVNDDQFATPDHLQSNAEVQEYPLLAVREFRARLLLTLTAFLALTACFVVLIYCLPKIWLSRSYSALFLVIVIGLVVAYTSKERADNIFPIYDTLLERVECFRTLENTDKNECKSLSTNEGRPSFAQTGNTVLVAAAFAFTVSIWRLLSALPSLRPQAATDEKSLSLRKEVIREASQEITVHLYLASALLVVSVISLHSYYSWPAAIVADDTLANGLRGLATIVALVFGAVFTFLIVVVIGPALYVINERTDELAKEAAQILSGDTSEDTARTWRQENGFVTTIQQRVFRLMATIGPLLAGPIVDLLNVRLV